MQITCENCGGPGFMKEYYVKRWKHHFCCNDCYHEYRRNHPEEYKTKKPKNMESQHKIQKLADLYKERRFLNGD